MRRRAHAAATCLHAVAGMYRAIWGLSRGHRRALAAVLTGLVAARLTKLAVPLLFALGVNALQRNGGQALGTPLLCLVGIVGAAAAYLLLYVPARTAERLVALRIRQTFMERLYGRLTRLPLGWHERHHSGELGHRVRSSSDALFEFAQSQAFYLQSVVTIVGSVATLLVFDAWTALVAAAGYTTLFALLLGVDSSVMGAMGTQNEAEARLSAEITDHTGNALTVLTLGLQERTRALLGRRLAEVATARRRVITMQQRKWAAVDALNELMWCVLVASAAWSTWRSTGTVAVGSVVLVGQYATEMTGAVMAGANHWQQVLALSADHRNAAPIEREPTEQLPERPVSRDWRRLVLQRVTWRHPTAPGAPEQSPHEAGVHDLDLTLHRGERLALVGTSGAGKSTLLRLLAGLHRVDTGRILLDGDPVPDTRSLRTVATLVPQEAEIFTSTLRHNLTLGLRAGTADLATVCRIAQLDQVVAELPNGLETDLTERGVNLSGGQRQRIALSRGLLAAGDRSLLLLDEPTSNLDPETEQAVYQALFEHFADACVVSSVHRLDLLPWFHRVALLEHGRLVDVGTVEELLERRPAFRRLLRRRGRREPRYRAQAA